MMMKTTFIPKTLLLACFVANLVTIQARIFGRCELARMLNDNGLDGYQGYSLANWVCLAFFTSGFDTKAVENNNDGSKSFGIFQINSDWWCQDTGYPSENLCYVSCNDLLNSEIKDDIHCVKRIVEDPQGLEAWDEWTTHCKNQSLNQWVNGCKL
ncbi:lysozyme C-1-like [Tiliqua scincoides]|uniref:lysozyme C-1-like n=1 Tax=Tiliqua scincoides TaxID=71010 RepID=UPI00346360EC